MRQQIGTAGLIFPFALCMAAGCFSLARDTPPLEQYVLGRAPVSASAAASPDIAGVTIGLRRLDLASYLATPAVVVRRGAHQIVLSEFHRWAEDPALGINRATGRYLAAAVPVRAVDVAPWPVRSQHDYLIQLHVARFEGVAPEDPAAVEGEVHVGASWEIIRPQDGAVLARGDADYRESGWRVGDYAGLVTLLDRGLSELALDLAACLGRVAAATSPTGGDVEPMPSRAPALVCVPRAA